MRPSIPSPVWLCGALSFACSPAPADDTATTGGASESSSVGEVGTGSATATAGTTDTGMTTVASAGTTGTTASDSGDASDSGGETGNEAPMLPFPRLGGMLIGNPKSYDDPEYQAEIARLDLAILGMYFGWGPGDATPASAVAEIRALHPEMLIGEYTLMTEVHESNPATQALRDKLDAEVGPGGVGDWWARDANGNHTDWANGGYGSWDTNLTLYTTPDANGDHWTQWLAGADYERLVGNIGVDIWYSDNNMWRPRSDADWDRDGTNDDNDDLDVQNAWRDGQRAYYDRAKEIAPELLVMVNADSDLSGKYKPANAEPFEQYKNVVHGAYLEHVMGASYSVENQADGWYLAMDWYREVGVNLLAPSLVMFEVELPSATSYQYFRYAFATTLMLDGYFAASVGGYHEIPWFDEYDLAGTADTKWLGLPIDPPQTDAYQNGVWMRRFEHGLALVNPKGNGEQTIDVPAGYHHLTGSQVPALNDGSAATSVTLDDRDGLLLVADGS